MSSKRKGRAAAINTADNDPTSPPTSPPASPRAESSSAAVVLREFTPEQENRLQIRFDNLNAAIDEKINHRFDIMMQQLQNWMSDLNPAQNPNPTTTADPSPAPHVSQSIENPHPQRQNFETPLTSPSFRPPVLKAKEVGFYNPDVPDEHGKGPVATVGSDTVYRDIYTWVERLKDLVHVHGAADVRQIIQPCLRGSAATWWIAELTDDDRKKLRDADLQRWYSLLIRRFKMQTSVAISQLTSSSYSPQDLHRSPRIWIHQMLHFAKAAEMDSTYNQLTIVWNRLDANLRKDIPMPKPNTRLADFLDQIDAMYPTWVDIKKIGGYRQHGFQPQGPYQRRDLQNPQRDGPTHPQSQLPGQSGAGPPNRNGHFERRPWRGKDRGKDAYMVTDEGNYEDEDPDAYPDDDYANNG